MTEVDAESEARYHWVEGFDDVISRATMGLSRSQALDSLGIYPCNSTHAKDRTGYCNLVAGAVSIRNDLLGSEQIKQYIDGAYVAANIVTAMEVKL